MDFEKIQQLPVYKKAHEIMEITHAIVDSIDEADDQFGSRAILMEHALTMTGKIANAAGGQDYSRSMEMAVLVKIAACELKVQSNWLTMNKLIDKKYVTLLRNEIDAFKPIFVEWVKTFDPKDDYNDGWLYITPPIKDDEEANKAEGLNNGGMDFDDFDFNDFDSEDNDD